MNEDDKYMQDFKKVFEALESWGPGCTEDTTKAFNLLKSCPERILEIGCGNGNATMTLAYLSKAQIIATDNEPSALDRLDAKIKSNRLNDRVSTQCVSMTELNFETEQFDLIWAEGSAYVMGVQEALTKWQPLLQSDGKLVFSDLVWLTDTPAMEAVEFWKREYPDMQTIDCRISQIVKAGYNPEQSFTLSEQAWKNYYEPLQERLNEVASFMADVKAVADIQKEINLYKSYGQDYGYQFFICTK